MKNIGFYGATGSNDFGDYAMMVHNILQIIHVEEEAHIYIFSPNKYNTLHNLCENMDWSTIKKHITIVDELRWSYKNKYLRFLEKVLRLKHIEVLQKRNFEKLLKGDLKQVPFDFIELIKNIDVLIFNGGGYVQHNWFDKNIIFLASCVIAKQHGVKVYFLGNSIGPMFKYNYYLEKTLPFIDKILLRDGVNYSKQVLDSYNFKNYIIGTDDLLFVNDYYDVKPELSEYVVIELMFYIQKAKKGDRFILNELVDFINFISKNKNVLLINFDCNDISATQYMRFLMDNVNDKSKIFIKENVDNIFEVFGYYKYAVFSLSFKYHPIILSLGSNVPCIGIICDTDGYYESKMKGAFDSSGLNWNEKVIHIDELNSKTLIHLYDINISKREEYLIKERSRLKSLYNNYLEEVLHSSDYTELN